MRVGGGPEEKNRSRRDWGELLELAGSSEVVQSRALRCLVGSPGTLSGRSWGKEPREAAAVWVLDPVPTVLSRGAASASPF